MRGTVATAVPVTVTPMRLFYSQQLKLAVPTRCTRPVSPHRNQLAIPDQNRTDCATLNTPRHSPRTTTRSPKHTTMATSGTDRRFRFDRGYHLPRISPSSPSSPTTCGDHPPQHRYLHFEVECPHPSQTPIFHRTHSTQIPFLFHVPAKTPFPARHIEDTQTSQRISIPYRIKDYVP